MPVKIRLARKGAKKRPFYWLVAADSRSPRDGKFIEKLGTYDPMLERDKRSSLNFDRISFWLDNGAQPTDRVSRILSDARVIKRTQRYNPQKGSPKKKALDGMRKKHSGLGVQKMELTEAEVAEIRNILGSVVG